MFCPKFPGKGSPGDGGRRANYANYEQRNPAQLIGDGCGCGKRISKRMEKVLNVGMIHQWIGDNCMSPWHLFHDTTT